MSKLTDRMRLKDKIISNVAKAIKAIQEYQYYSQEQPIVLSNIDWQCHKLCEYLDHALLHGLRHITNGYWKVVVEFTRKDVLKEIKRLQSVTTNLGRGRAWLFLALNESLLESYIRCLTENTSLVKKNYVREALVLDEQRMNVLMTLTSGLEYVSFQLEVDIPYLDFSVYPPKARRSSNSDAVEDDRVSLCSMDSIVSRSSRAETFTSSTPDSIKGLVENSSDTGSFNSAELSSQATSIGKSNSFSLSIDSGCHVDNFVDSKPAGHDSTDNNQGVSKGEQNQRFNRLENMIKVLNSNMVDEPDAGLEVLRVKTKGAKSKKRKSKRMSNQTEQAIKEVSYLQKDEGERSQIFESSSPSSSTDDVQKTSPNSLSPSAEAAKFSDGDIVDSSLGKDEVFKEANPDVRLNDCNGISVGTDGNCIFGKGDCFTGISASETGNGVSGRRQGIPVSACIPGVYDRVQTSENGEVDSANLFRSHCCDSNNKSFNSNDFSSLNGDSEVLDVSSSCDKHSVGVSKNEVESVSSKEDCNHNIKTQTDEEAKNSEDVTKPVLNSQLSEPDDIYRGNASCSSVEQIEPSNSLKHTDIVDYIMQSTANDKSTPDLGNMCNSFSAKSLIESSSNWEISIDNNSMLHLMLDVFKFEDEHFVKMYPGRLGHTEGETSTVFVLITDKCSYLLKPRQIDQKFISEAIIPHKELDYVSLGLNNQFIQIVCTNRRKQYWVNTGDEQLTNAIVTTMNQAIERNEFVVPKLTVCTDATTQRIAIKKYLASEMKCQPADVDLFRYCLVHWDDPSNIDSSSESISKEGYLLFKLPDSMLSRNHWKTVFLSLRDGLLCIYTREQDSKPQSFLHLLNEEECQGCRRLTSADRNYCFEIVRSDGSAWQFSAATMEEANEWLQTLCEVVAKGMQTASLKPSSLPCCAVITNQKILLCHEDITTSFFRTLGSANIVDVTAMSTDPEDLTYCIVIFDPQDSRYSSEQWVLYFNSENERNKFMEALSRSWHEEFQVDTPSMFIDNLSVQQMCQGRARKLRLGTKLKS